MARNIVWTTATAAAFALATLAGPAPAAAQDTQTEHVTQTVAVAPGGTLRLKSFSGKVTITAADRQDVAIDAVRRATRDRLDRVKLDIHAEGSTLVVDANHRDSDGWMNWFGRRDQVVDTEFDIKVPRHFNLDVVVFSSPVVVNGVDGESHVRTFSAPIQLDNVNGPVEAKTFSGAVSIQTRAWQDRQSIDVNTFSGDVQLKVPDSASATVEFNSFSGRLSAGMPLTFNEVNRRNMTARLGGESATAGTMHLKTFSGNVRIDK